MSATAVLDFVTLALTGFIACAEFGSYAFVHPVTRNLPPTEHIHVEQGLLRTFGRVMPVGMTLCLVLSIAHASISGGHGGPAPWRCGAGAAFAGSSASTILFNLLLN